MKSIRLLALLLSSLSFAAAGCAPGSEIESSEQADDDSDALSLAVETIAVSKNPAPPGLTVLTKKSEYVAFFGAEPPASLNFNKSWVLHYSMGIQNTGGFAASIASVERQGSGASSKITVHPVEASPGPNCIVTMALSNPQVTVKIPKQKKGVPVEMAIDYVTTDCGTVQGWCATATCGSGQVCDEFSDSCVKEPWCPKVKCANGYVCDEDVDACVGRPCDAADSESCPVGFVCDNQIQCVTTPCPADFRCEPAPAVSCADIGWVGVCQGPVLKYCDGDTMTTQTCSPGQCDFVESLGYFDCVE